MMTRLALTAAGLLLAAQATEVVTGTQQEFRKVVQDSMVKNAVLVKAVGLKAD